MTSYIASVLSFTGWKKTFANSLAVVLMSAVPAFALVDWEIKKNKQTNGAPPAQITFNGDTATVNMGVNTKPHSTSTVVIRGTFTSPGALFSLASNFATLMRDGFIEVFARVIPSRGVDAFNQRFFRNVNGAAELVSNFQSTQRFLKAGKYKLEITIRYVNRKGSWDNTGSPHRFTLTSP